jgi:hypothetical protein
VAGTTAVNPFAPTARRPLPPGPEYSRRYDAAPGSAVQSKVAAVPRTSWLPAVGALIITLAVAGSGTPRVTVTGALPPPIACPAAESATTRIV